jgi:cytochrome b pre-mRNA-processing protein 3
MIFHLFRRTPGDRTITTLYGTIVAQARVPAFYQNYGVPDTVNGRFEMIVLHTVVLLDRLNAGPGSLRALGQGIFDMFCNDMDANLREMGVGDLAVPKRMRRIGEAFYGRQAVYREALTSSDSAALAAALARNVLGADAATSGAELLGSYMREAVRRLAAQDDAALGRGEISFPATQATPVLDPLADGSAR